MSALSIARRITSEPEKRWSLPGPRIAGRAFLVNTFDHAIDVVDERGRPLFSFGGFGPLIGQFHTPSAVAIVSLDPSEPRPSPASAVLAVADRGNHRVQFFDLDGTPVSGLAARHLAGRPARSGWPFFRLATIPRLVSPSRLEWRAPFLDVTTTGGAIVRLHLPDALLPEFSDWLRLSSPAELRAALNHFLREPYRDEIPGSCLRRIAEQLKPSASVVSGWPA